MESESIEIAGRKISLADWDATPESIKLAIEDLHGMVAGLSQRVSALEEKINKNSKNSSIPPSKSGFGGGVKQAQNKQDKKTPKQRTKNTRSEKKLYPPDECSAIHEEKPPACSQCGEELEGSDPEPYRHQIIEMPIIRPDVVEYQLHELECEHCGAKTRADLPVGVTQKCYGHGLAAWIAILSGEYRQSYRQVERLLSELCGVELSRGTIGRARAEISDAVAVATAAAGEHVQQQPVVNVDETGFKQYNRDGQNPGQTRGWLWVVVTPLVSFFTVVLSRSKATAQALLGDFKGVVGSDRCPSYNWLNNDHRQVCWAHLLRDFQAMADRSGASAEIGTSLLKSGHRLFHWWHKVRDGTISRELFIEAVRLLRAGVIAELESAVALPVGVKEQTPLAKTVRSCQQILNVEAALWTFVDHLGVEPTNNVAERALRPAVIWRNTSFGSQSQGGSEFVARMLTVSSSLKAQSRSLLDFLTESCQAYRLASVPPSLIPLPQQPVIPPHQVFLLP
jgi:transposase